MTSVDRLRCTAVGFALAEELETWVRLRKGLAEAREAITPAVLMGVAENFAGIARLEATAVAFGESSDRLARAFEAAKQDWGGFAVAQPNQEDSP